MKKLNCCLASLEVQDLGTHHSTHLFAKRGKQHIYAMKNGNHSIFLIQTVANRGKQQNCSFLLSIYEF